MDEQRDRNPAQQDQPDDGNREDSPGERYFRIVLGLDGTRADERSQPEGEGGVNDPDTEGDRSPNVKPD